MKKKIIISVIAATLILSIGIIGKQYAKDERSEKAKFYMNMLQRALAHDSISYDYNMQMSDSMDMLVNTRGKLYKMANNFIDSNDLYYKVLTDSVFLNIDKTTQVAYYFSIKELEKKMGFLKEDLNGEVFQISDSSFKDNGTWQQEQRINDSLNSIVFTVNDTLKPIKQFNIVFNRLNNTLVRLDFTMQDLPELLSPGTKAKIEVYNVRQDNIPLSAKAQHTVTFEGTKPQLTKTYNKYKIIKML